MHSIRQSVNANGAMRAGNRALQPKVLAKMALPNLKYLGHHGFVTFVDRWMAIECKIVFPSQ